MYTNPPCVNCVMDPGVLPGHSVVFDEEGEERQTVLWEAHGTEQGVAHNADATDVLFGHQPNAVKTVLNLPVGAAGAGAWNPPNAGRSWRKQYTDPSGNLTFDGEYFYQYDAWNRLVQVNRSGNLTAWRFDKWGMPRHLEAGFIRPSSCGIPAELGALVKHQTYDGVGKLIRTSSPIQAPEGLEFEAIEGGGSAPDPWFTRSERFFYDGTRCVQEVVIDPVVVDLEGNPVASMGSESDQRGGGGSGGSSTGVPPMLKAVLRAQYVWGPGDGINGADELLCQLDPRDTSSSSHAAGGGKPYYPLTDAQGDVVALVHVPLVGLGLNPIVAEVAGQWTYSPYGEVLSYEQFHPHPALVYGHKTLRVDRIDGEALTWEYDEPEPETTVATGVFFETRRLEPGARLFSYARNRTLDSKHGRWLQLDPNASGAVVSEVQVFNGNASCRAMALVSLETRAGDGINLFLPLRSNPLRFQDSMGLIINEVVSPYATIGMAAGQIANDLVSQYSERQDYDADWALDWAAPDNASSRLDSSWIDEIYAAANINGAVDDFANPLSVIPGMSLAGVASEISDWNRVTRGYNKLGKVGHHVISWYKKTRARLEGLKKAYGFKFSPWELDNLLPLDKVAHGAGRHKGAYHSKVFAYIEAKLKAAGKTGEEARAVFLNALNEVKGKILKDPAAWFDP